MALRASIEEVRDILGDDEAVILPQLIVANEMVDAWLMGSGLGTATLRNIEIFLACHIYSLSTSDIVRESYDGATFEYSRGQMGKWLDATKWGQMARLLDTSKTLESVGKIPVTIHVI
jgi:hypothetical protein